MMFKCSIDLTWNVSSNLSRFILNDCLLFASMEILCAIFSLIEPFFSLNTSKLLLFISLLIPFQSFNSFFIFILFNFFFSFTMKRSLNGSKQRERIRLQNTVCFHWSAGTRFAMKSRSLRNIISYQW